MTLHLCFFCFSVVKYINKKLFELAKLLKLPQQRQFYGKSILLPIWFVRSTNAKLTKTMC